MLYVTKLCLQKENNMQKKKNKNIYKLINVNETIIEQKNQMIEETISLLMIIQQHHEKIIFDIVFIIKHDIVLKIS